MPDRTFDDVGRAPLRRLSRRELGNTLNTLLGLDLYLSQILPVEETYFGFDNNTAAQSMSTLWVSLYFTTISQAVITFLGQSAPLAACGEPDQSPTDACLQRFLDDFVARAFRRPLTPAEREAYTAHFRRMEASLDPQEALRGIVERALQSPHFLYRPEFGRTSGAGTTGDLPLTPWEIASRLSYFLTQNMPDGPLLAAAASDGLSTPEQVRAQAERLLQGPAAREALKDFGRQWLRSDAIDPNPKSPELFPDYDAALRADMKAETNAFLLESIFGGGTLEELLTASHTYATPRLARIVYGVDGGTGTELRRIELPAGQRSGLLTLPGFLTAQSKVATSSPTRRGRFVREQLLCTLLPSPPVSVTAQPPPRSETQTERDAITAHAQDPRCAPCHRLIDPIGFGLDAFDAIGRYHAPTADAPLDTRGSVNDTSIGDFDGALDLGRRLGTSDEVRGCITTQMFRFAFGRTESAADAETLARVKDDFSRNQYRLLDLVLAITGSAEFRHRPGATP